MAHGHGRLVLVCGDIYVGEFKCDKANGRGKYLRVDRSSEFGIESYDGEWRDDEKCGRGVECFPDGSCYEGEFFHNRAHGIGIYLDTDGTSYEGEWYDDMKCGHGLESYPDGSHYTGTMKKN